LLSRFWVRTLCNDFFLCAFHSCSRYYSHDNDYLEICRCYKAIYEIPSVKENPAQWIPVRILFSSFWSVETSMDSIGRPWYFTTRRSWGKSVGTWYFHLTIQCSQAFWIPPWRIRIFLKFQNSSTCCFSQFLHVAGHLIYQSCHLVCLFIGCYSIGCCWSSWWQWKSSSGHLFGMNSWMSLKVRRTYLGDLWVTKQQRIWGKE
jgi:hypothetical protein